MKSKIKIILAFILGITLSVVISVTAATIINSKNVLYDNTLTGLTANVQDAIDETYTKASSISSTVAALSTDISNIEGQIDSILYDKGGGVLISNYSYTDTVNITDANYHILTNYFNTQNTTSGSDVLEIDDEGIKVKKSGNYLISAHGIWTVMPAAIAGNVKRIGIYINSANVRAITERANSWDTMYIPAFLVELTEGDIVQLGTQCEGASTTNVTSFGYYGLQVIYLND